jgi:drug/metabolite transporter (DMT)-like permease
VTAATATPGERPASPLAALSDPYRGIGLLLLALILFAFADMLAKRLNAALSPVEIAWLRYVVSAIVLVPMLVRHRRRILETARPGLQIARGFGILGSAVGFICAVRYVPLAEATATSFISPVFITALSVIFLGERPGIRRWSAIAVGLAGMLIVVRPLGAGFHWQALYAVISAASWAVAMIVTRRTAHSDGAVTTMTWTAIVGLTAVTLWLPFEFVVPTAYQLGLGLLAGTANTIAQWLALAAYRSADASLLAPFSYAQLIWATMFGYLAFGAIPDLWTFTGAGIIAASGLYIAHRERIVAHAQVR